MVRAPRQIGIAVVLTLLEVGKDVPVTPARITERFPLVVIQAVASGVDHRVEDGGAPQDFAAGPVAAVAVHRQAVGGVAS